MEHIERDMLRHTKENGCETVNSNLSEIRLTEREYLLEYYSVREGSSNSTAMAAMLVYFWERGQEMSEFFTTYSVDPSLDPPRK
ncbi:hypothetical protein OH76DRAFT_1483459 [Lentinus brumalis]|uniref:Uncharacterized protein n=1 Tax=Lentinus brumalis TaxID=2498619 RepID=A0A371D8V2_9APHY|nr:hypothetical protein OH76DRAFT_1483459 [Polyporus brumalis]